MVTITKALWVMNFKDIVLSSAMLLVTGCMPFDVNRTDSPLASNVANRCFKLLNDSFVYRACGFGEGGVQIDSISSNDECLPASILEFEKNPEMYDFCKIGKYFKTVINSGRCTIIVLGYAKAGSEFFINKVEDSFGGTDGRYWALYGQFSVEGLGNIEAELPQRWFGPRSVYSEVYINRDYLNPCN